MASNFTKRLDRLERLIRERTQPETHPLYFRDGQPIPEVIDPSRVVFIKREMIDPPEREEEQLPEAEAQQIEPERVRNFGAPLHMPKLAIV